MIFLSEAPPSLESKGGGDETLLLSLVQSGLGDNDESGFANVGENVGDSDAADDDNADGNDDADDEMAVAAEYPARVVGKASSSSSAELK